MYASFITFNCVVAELERYMCVVGWPSGRVHGNFWPSTLRCRVLVAPFPCYSVSLPGDDDDDDSLIVCDPTGS